MMKFAATYGVGAMTVREALYSDWLARLDEIRWWTNWIIKKDKLFTSEWERQRAAQPTVSRMPQSTTVGSKNHMRERAA
jgi:hypothetical protein